MNEVKSKRVISRWPSVHKQTGKSRIQTWRDVGEGKFPAPVQLGPNSVGWYQAEIDEWLANRPRVTYAPKGEVA